MNHCLRHYEEPTAAVCRSCQGPFCTRCLVFSYGPKKPPYCVGCALIASGVRNGSLKSNRARVRSETELDAAVSAGTEPEKFDWSRPVHTHGGSAPHRESFEAERTKRGDRHKRSIFGRRRRDRDQGDPPAGGATGGNGGTGVHQAEPMVAAASWSAPDTSQDVRDAGVSAPSDVRDAGVSASSEVRDTRVPAPSQLRLAALAALAREM